MSIYKLFTNLLFCIVGILLVIFVVIIVRMYIVSNKEWKVLITQAVTTDSTDIPIKIKVPGTISVAVYYHPRMSPLDPVKYGSYYFTIYNENDSNKLYFSKSLDLKALKVFWVGGKEAQTYRDGFTADIDKPGNYLLNIRRMAGECCYVDSAEIYFKDAKQN